jgi:GNAT superfamily N-acetyltransferase
MEIATPTRSMITYQVEPFDTAFEEAQELLEQHWEEIALNKDKIKLAIDKDRYKHLYDSGILHIVTVRDANEQKWSYDPGKLIGYHVSMIVPHLHYKNDLHGMTDIFFIHPDYRKGRIGIEMFKFVEKSLKERGVVKLMTAVKLHKDIGAIFERLGWTEIERLYSKYIGD